MPLNHVPLPPALEIVCEGVPGRLNEDAWLVMQSGHLGERVLIAAIDGATTRLTPPLLQRYLNTLPQKLTPAAYAARLVRDALARLIAEGVFTDLRALLVEARSAARARPIEAQLTRTPAGYSGTLVFHLGDA